VAVTSTTSLFQYAVASLGQAFSPSIPIQNATDFVVIDTNVSTLIDTVLVLNVDYFLSGTFTNGVCINPTIILEGTGLHYAVGDTLTIERAPSLTQPTTYADGVKYLAATTNNALDWLCYGLQELSDQISRCLRVPTTSTVQTPLSIGTRKGGLLGFDVNGNAKVYAYPTTPGATTGIVSNTNLIGPTGGGGNHLDGLDASVYSIGTIIQFTLGGIGQGQASQYQLTTSNAVAGPGIVAALNVPTARWIQIL
jgi:hypothetical protein